MARPLSLDLRWRVAAPLTAGATVREAAARFEVAVTASAAFSSMSGRRLSRLLAARPCSARTSWPIRTALVTTRLASKADGTVRALAADLRVAGIAVAPDTVWRFLRRRGLSFKKTLLTSETDRPDLARRRTRWRTHQHRSDPARLVFVDGSRQSLEWGQDQHDAHPRLEPARHAAAGQGTARPLEDAHLPRRPAP
ncbi:hypothetical protein ACFQS7_24360 [Dankookia sp. GCM10030260]|uniref:hypothetical protein n=1 Tax=Dankookia sp. GCM10030260 TaxID=3273390 RepID=UPI0036185D8B